MSLIFHRNIHWAIVVALNIFKLKKLYIDKQMVQTQVLTI